MSKNRRPKIRAANLPEIPPSPATTVPKLANLSFRRYQKDRGYCLSACNNREIRSALDCFRKVTSLPWVKVHSDRGLRWTSYDKTALKIGYPSDLDQGVTIAAVRASDKFRVFGFRADDTFYVLWFDPNHKIVPV